MSEVTLSVKHQQRSDTSLNWSSNNPVLLVGEIGIETNTGKIKVGNGITAWNSLAYVGISKEYLDANYIRKYNGINSGYLALTDTNSKITRSSTSPYGHNIGANGVMLTHNNGDEGGLLINEDGAYLWNSTDSGSALKILDEDVWTAYSGAKKDCNFMNGLLFQVDNAGNVKCKGKFYQDNGGSTVGGGGNGVVLWTGHSSSIDPATFSVSDWKTRFSALLVSTSGTVSTTFVVPIKGETSNIRVGGMSANFYADYDIVMYDFDITVPITGGSLYLAQNYISWQSNTKTWKVSPCSLTLTRVVGII